MEKPIFIGLSHVCIFVDDVEEAFAYYERILGAVPNQHPLENGDVHQAFTFVKTCSAPTSR